MLIILEIIGGLVVLAVFVAGAAGIYNHFNKP